LILTIQAKVIILVSQATFPTFESVKNFVGIRFKSAFHYYLACFRPSSDNFRIKLSLYKYSQAEDWVQLEIAVVRNDARWLSPAFKLHRDNKVR